MRRLAAGVGVVTAIGVDGPTGMAATSITSLTVEPPSMLVCVNRTAGLHAVLAPGARLCVNLLSSNQRDVAAAFGGRLRASSASPSGAGRPTIMASAGSTAPQGPTCRAWSSR